MNTSTISFTKQNILAVADEKKDALTVIETLRTDGATSTVYGSETNDDGKVVGDHGHLVEKDGEIVYLRDDSGNVIVDTGT